MSRFLNDGTSRPPSLRVYLNLDTLVDLRPDTCWTGATGLAMFEQLAADGFDGVQQGDTGSPLPGVRLPYCGCDRVNVPDDARRIVGTHAELGRSCLTVHAGWGLENDSDAIRLLEAICEASEFYGMPVFVETHRATVTQDLWRTVQFAKRLPGLRFNGDFSHYYTGLEMVYGGLQMKLDFLTPLFEKVGFLHGRIGSPGCIQVSITNEHDRPSQAFGASDFLADFKEIWTRSMQGFLRKAVSGDYLVFCPELLSRTHYYARCFPDASGRLVEESDRYSQALLLKNIAKACFAEAGRRERRDFNP